MIYIRKFKNNISGGERLLSIVNTETLPEIPTHLGTTMKESICMCGFVVNWETTEWQVLFEIIIDGDQLDKADQHRYNDGTLNVLAQKFILDIRRTLRDTKLKQILS
jgi:hypothetical protein